MSRTRLLRWSAALGCVLALSAVAAQASHRSSSSPDRTLFATTSQNQLLTFNARNPDPRPAGLYELWFVAPDDRDRVSAGTFHPDDDGRGTVRLVGAADPKRYPRLSVTLEPADGNPRRQGPTVLRAMPRG